LARRKRKNVLFILVTEGGDADPAYRIARHLQDSYTKFSFFVTGYCKSAGTLVAFGAHELVFGDAGELGPLDVQLSKEDELGETRSGLTVLSALSTLHRQAFAAFEYFLLETKRRSRNSITTKTATQVAVQLTCGLFSPIYQHVDPMHVGEAGRALQIAQKYGELLQLKSLNYDADTLHELVNRYPHHGFIIDRREAERLFSNVRLANATEGKLAELLSKPALDPINTISSTMMAFLSTEIPAEATLPGLGVVTTDHAKSATRAAATSHEVVEATGTDAPATEHPHAARVRPIR